jgi:hypothetical protein
MARTGCRDNLGSFLDPRYELDLDLHKRHDGIDLDVDVERHGKWLKIDVELNGLDLDLKVDARQLQPDEIPTAALIGGEGNAVGEQTLVDADIFCRQIDFGSVTVAFGTATFKSAAVAEGDLLAFAGAETFASISGADLILVLNERRRQCRLSPVFHPRLRPPRQAISRLTLRTSIWGQARSSSKPTTSIRTIGA